MSYKKSECPSFNKGSIDEESAVKLEKYPLVEELKLKI